MEEFSDQPLEQIIDAPEENFGEDDTVGLPGKSNSQQKRGHDDESEIGGGEKRWPGWPGENVFRILVPAQKVGGIIGRKGEFIKKMCEETRARIKILDGPPGTQERAVLSVNLRKQIIHQSDSKIRRTNDPDLLGSALYVLKS